MGVYLLSGTATIDGYMSADISLGATATGLKAPINTITTSPTATNSFMTSSGVSSVTLGQSFTLNAILRCATSGVFQMQWGSEVALAASTLNSGGLVVRQLN